MNIVNKINASAVILFFVLLLISACGQPEKEPAPVKTADSTKIAMAVFPAAAERDSMTVFIDSLEIEYQLFKQQLKKLYIISETNRKKPMVMADSLIKVFESRDDNKTGALHYFKGEIFYNSGAYTKALNEFTFETGHYNEICEACIYTKMGKSEKVEGLLSKVVPGYYLYDLEFAMYYETIGDKEKALKKYKEMKADTSTSHYFFYKIVLQRIIELQKENPVFLTELYFPTGREEFEIVNAKQ